MLTAIFLAALLAQSGGPHFSEDPDAISTPGASQSALASPPATSATVRVVATPLQRAAMLNEKDDPVTCQTVDVTGTHFGAKSCLTKSQWEQQARDGKDLYEQFDFKGGWGMDGGH